VISSTISSIPEIAGEACVLVDPYDIDAIAGAILELDVDDELCDELSARGRQRARLFSREAHQAKIEQVYRAVS
jgi:glycosyltransferase involved in cell wall biosynthesis